MALVLADRVKESSNSTGSGPFVVGGAAAGYQTLSVGIGDGNSSYFAAWDGAAKWLVFRGTFTQAGNSVSVDTVLAQSAGFAGFTGPFTIWGDSPANLMTPLLQMSASAAGVQVTTQLGVGAPPAAGVALDVTQNVNTAAVMRLRNTNAGSGAYTIVSAANDQSHAMQLGIMGSAAPAGFAGGNTGLLTTEAPNGMAIYTQVAQPIRFGINTVEVARFDTNGNFGVGTTTPAVALEVSANISSQAPYIRSKNLSTTGIATLQAYNDAGKSIQIMQFGSGVLSGNMNAPNRSMIYVDGVNGLAISVGSNAPLIFGTGNAERARFDQAGNFGIGKNNPTNILDIARDPGTGNAVVGKVQNLNSGSGSLSFFSAVNDTGVGASIGAYASNTTGAGQPYGGNVALFTATSPAGLTLGVQNTTGPIMFALNYTEVGRFHTNGCLGIGNNAPANSNPIDVIWNTNGAAYISLQNGSGGASNNAGFKVWNNVSHSIAMYMLGTGWGGGGPNYPDGGTIWCDGNGGITIGTGQHVPINFWTNSVAAGQFGADGFFSARGSYTGSISAGAHNFYQTVNANTTVQIRNDATSGGFNACQFNYTADPNMGGNSFLVCYGGLGTTYSVRFVVYSNGGIGNYSANNTNLSDAKLKDHIEPLGSNIVAGLWAAHRDMKWTRYWYKDQTHSDWNWGYTAQDVSEAFANVAPELVDELEPDGVNDPETGKRVIPPSRKSVYLEDLHNIGHALLSEAQRRIEKLEAEIAEIKKRGVLH